jgi:hypothetical protein
MRFCLCFLLVLSALSHAQVTQKGSTTRGDRPKCWLVTKSGRYDLRALSIVGGEHELEDNRNGKKMKFFFNVCGQITKSCNSEPGKDKNDSGPPAGPSDKNLAAIAHTYINNQFHNCITVGTLDSMILTELTHVGRVNDAGVNLTYIGTDRCPYRYADKVRMQILVTCNPDGGLGAPVSVDSADPCDFIVHWPSTAGCPRRGMSAGSLCVVFFFFIMFMYCCIGASYQMEEKGATGWEIMPHFEMWSSLYELCRDGCRFTYSTIMKVVRPDHAEEYEPVYGGPAASF